MRKEDYRHMPETRRSESRGRHYRPSYEAAYPTRASTLTAEGFPTAAFIIGLIGVIIGAITAAAGIAGYYLVQQYGPEILGRISPAYTGLTQPLLTWTLISSIIGVILTLVLLIVLIRLYTYPTKGAYTLFLVLGIIGLFFNLGLGAVLIIISGITGIVQLKNYEKRTAVA